MRTDGSLEMCCARILNQWPTLLESSLLQSNNKDELAKKVYAEMIKPETICYIYLLQHSLGHLNKLNKFFQRSDAVIHEAADMIEATYKNILLCFKRPDYIIKTPACKIDLFNENYNLPLSHYYLGESFGKLNIDENCEGMKTFFNNSYRFLSALCLELRTRFNVFNDEIYSCFKCLNPQYALSPEFHEAEKDLFESYLKTFSALIGNDIIKKKIRYQWNLLTTLTVEGPQMKIGQFWNLIYNFKDADNNYVFQDFANVALISLCVPHGNADPERKFSQMNDLKTKNRSCLLLKTMGGTLRTANLCKLFEVNKGGFEPTDDMIDRYLRKDYYEKKE